MSLRNFRAADGTTWTAWSVDIGTAPVVPGTPTEWLAFQNEEGTERRRLVEFPAEWPQLSDRLLELLRRMAEPVVSWQRPSPPDGVARQDAPVESDAPE